MPTKFKLVFAKSFRKSIRKILVDIRENIIAKITRMQFDPFNTQVKKLAGDRLGKYRKRVGDYRVTFDVNYKDAEIWFYKIKHRKDIYR